MRLLYHQILTEHFFGVFDNIIDRKCEAHAAFGIFRRTDKGTFTTSTSVDLGFDDPKWLAKFFSRSAGLRRIENGNAFADRCADGLKNSFALIFVDINEVRPINKFIDCASIPRYLPKQHMRPLKHSCPGQIFRTRRDCEGKHSPVQE